MNYKEKIDIEISLIYRMSENYDAIFGAFSVYKRNGRWLFRDNDERDIGFIDESEVNNVSEFADKIIEIVF